jgi:hypothetical protein
MLLAARRVIQTVKILARDGRIPKPLRGLVALECCRSQAR